MPLQPGTRLGPYEITTAIGAGGMGEVYQALEAAHERGIIHRDLKPANVKVKEDEPDWNALPTTTPRSVHRVGR